MGSAKNAVKASKKADKVTDNKKKAGSDEACPSKQPKVVNISKKKYGEAAEHIEDAQKAGKPSVLTVDKPGAAARRAESLKGLDKVPNKQLDEYPPAMFKEGGAGASVRPINPSANMGAGAAIGNACRGLKNGAKVKIVVVK